MALRQFAPLAQMEGVRFFSLQKGDAAKELANAPAGLELEDLAADFVDFSDTAAAISHLDLVICVDTAVAHLAGALGKPVWMLLRTPADWRWMTDREDTPWYPTMRLFRQHVSGDWSNVMLRVRAALEQSIREDWSLSSTIARPPHNQPTLQDSITDPDVSHVKQELAAVAETRSGILQYFPDQDTVGRSIRCYGEFLQPQLDLLKRAISTGATVVEVGAGVGAHSLSLSSLVGPGGHLFLYEARPKFRRALQNNLAANHVSNVTLMRQALSAPSTADVTIETLDELRLPRLDLLKISDDADPDAVLRGTTDVLWRLRPWVFISVPDAASLERIASQIRDFGYRCWRMETALFNPNNFNQRMDDKFARRSALALVAVPEEIEGDEFIVGCVALT
jgi:hypothetical protein